MQNKSKPWTARRIHFWASIILGVPMTFMAVSGILIGMRSVSDITVPMLWLGAETIPDRLPINAFVEVPGGDIFIGNLQGLYRVGADGATEPVSHFAGQEVVGVAPLPGNRSPVVATRMAIWVEKDGAWAPVRRGRVRQLSVLPDGRVLVINGGRGELADGKPFVSANGLDWQPYQPALRANSRLPLLENPQISLHQFMREVHSGAMFFGKGPGEIGWTNVVGWVLVLLSLTGLWMWIKTERAKARKRAGAQGHPARAASRQTVQAQGD